MLSDTDSSFEMIKSLERSCSASGRQRQAAKSWLREAPPSPGMERMEAFFMGQAYTPHRHDTYAIGYTLSGIQCFDYRGEERRSMPGKTIVLHPDELHDGRAGTDEGFQYRMIYVDPALISQALGGKPLPFIREAVQEHREIRHAIDVAFDTAGTSVEDLQLGDLILRLAECLNSTATSGPKKPAAIDIPAITRTRAYLRENIERSVLRDELETVSGLDRWTLARQFRRACGTSMSRYLAMRRLERVRQRLHDGLALADAAADAGFSDQNHMTRHFKRAYGISPGQWAKLSIAKADDLGLVR
jgi:AraC-like DNA-binding protein